MKTLIAALALLITTMTMGCYGTPTSTQQAELIKNTVQEVYPNFTIQKVLPSEIDGLFEIHGNSNIVYTDGEYLFVGHIMSFDGQRDLTQERLDSLIQQSFEPDVAAALTVTDGIGTKTVIMVTDPECPYCATADMWFETANTTRKILFYPLDFHPNAALISEHILCSADPEAEYKAVMGLIHEFFNSEKGGSIKEHLEQSGVTLSSCESGRKQLEEMKRVVEQAGISGTPMFIVDGELIEGADPRLREMIQ
jgi:thiol:disulfide interchange protein DsbC